MHDLDMLYDYYTGVNLAAGGYATLACRTKDDKVEKLFRNLTSQVMDESKATAEMVIKLGGKLY